ncbi:MAG: hypothetical protein IV100_02235, partial [Myxococcales bacterium]|nr:hypothetical protein [Myxococcales bacterium]
MTSTLSTQTAGPSGPRNPLSAVRPLQSALVAVAVLAAFGGCRRQERVKMVPAMEYIPQPTLPLTDRVPALEKEVERLKTRARDHEKVKTRIAELSSRLDKLYRADRISRGRARGLQLLHLALEGSPDALSFRRVQAIENRWTVLMHDRESTTPKAKNEREVLGLEGKSPEGLPVEAEELPRASSLFGLALQRAYGLDVPVEALPYSEEQDSIVESFSAGRRGERWVAYGYLHPLAVTREFTAPGGPALPAFLPMAPPPGDIELADIAPLRFNLPAPRGDAEPPPAPAEAPPVAPPAAEAPPVAPPAAEAPPVAP